MRKAKGLLGIIVGSFLLLHAGGNLAYADDHGNNGTLKVVSATDPGNDMDNDPKVCNFHLAGFKFDGSSSGTWSITGQGGGAGTGTASGAWTADASGNWQTANMTLPDGQYKASAKQTSPATSGGDKQKVFKVNCATTSAPATPTPGNGGGQGGGAQGGANQPASMTGTGSKTKGGTGSKSKANGSATGTGSQSKNNSNGSNAATNGGTAPSVNGTDNTASVSEHGEQGVTNAPATPTPMPTPTTNVGGEQGTAAASPTPSPSAQGFVNVPNTQNGANTGNGANNGANTGQNTGGAQGFSNLPSTSTDTSGPLTALGAILVAFGAFLLRRPGRQTR